MKLFLISPSTQVHQEIETVNYFLSLGIDLHIRKENYTIEKMQQYINSIDEAFFSQCSIHSSTYCNHITGIRRFHLKSNENVSVLNKETRKNYTFSKSLHSLEEYQREKKASYKYFFLSPIYNSISKEGYKSQFDNASLSLFFKKKKDNAHVPIMALGGIDSNNILKIKKLGFDGAVLLGSIWTLKTFEERKRKIEKMLKTLEILVH